MKNLSRHLLLCALAACVNREIVKPPESRRLGPQEIAAGLSSSSFREVLNARAQLAGLPDDAWLSALEPLVHDQLPQNRLVAVVELSRRRLDAARSSLSVLAEDPDETVRAEAAGMLAAGEGGAP